MPAALDKTYDGIIIGAGHHGLVLGSYLAKCGLDILLVDRRLQYGGGLSTQEVTQPGFYHNLHSINHFHITETPWFKDLNSRRARHLHHAALRARPAASRRLGAGVRPRPRRDAGQCRALLEEGRADLPRMEPPRRGDHPQHFPARALCRAAAAGRARGAAVAQRDGPRFPGGHATAAVRRGEGAVRERARAAAVSVQGVAVRHLAGRHHVGHQPDGLGDPRLRSRKRLPALPGRLVQPRARADGDVHRRGRPLPAAGEHRQDPDRRRQGVRHRAAGRPHGARQSSSSPRRSTCTRPSRP